MISDKISSTLTGVIAIACPILGMVLITISSLMSAKEIYELVKMALEQKK